MLLLTDDPPNPLDEFLAAYPPDLALLAQQACALIRKFRPDLVEQLDRSANLVAYGTDRTLRGMVCGVTVHKAHINLMFANGASLPDPHGLLTGQGKKARHIKMTSPEDLANLAVWELLLAALVAHP